MKTVEDDPEFDTSKAKKKLRRYVESHDHAIRQKAEIMVDHFHEQVIARRKIGGQARAMVICSGIQRAIQYFHAVSAYLTERKSQYRAIVAVYNSDLDEDGQVDFKGKAKAFVRTYQFFASILPYTSRDWEELSIFLNFLIPKLPAPVEEDLSKGILEAIDMDSYRNEVKETLKLALADEDGEVGPVPTSGGGRKPEPELDRLSNIIKAFNDQFGNIDWKDADRIRQVIADEIPGKVAADKAYQNAMKNNDKAAARLEHDRALQKVVIGMLADHTELFKQFSDNPGFKKWLADTIFGLTYDENAA